MSMVVVVLLSGVPVFRRSVGTLDTAPHQHRVGPISDRLEVVPCPLSTASVGSALFCSIQSAIAVGQGNQADLAEVAIRAVVCSSESVPCHC